jgi:hypothetical protein
MLFEESVAAVTAAEEEAADADVTFPTLPSSNLATAAVTATIVVPIDTAALSSKGMAFIESAVSSVFSELRILYLMKKWLLWMLLKATFQKEG